MFARFRLSSLSIVGRRLSTSPYEFAAALKKSGSRRASIIHVDGAYQLSHPEMPQMQEFVAILKEQHTALGLPQEEWEGVYMEVGKRSNALFVAAVHNTTRGFACGGCRVWRYNQMSDLFRDSARLAVGMTRKSALAGLWVGGGKSIIAADSNHVDLSTRAARDKVFGEYGEFLTSLRGVYQGAEDVGANVEDMLAAFRETRYITCVPESVGGSGNPSKLTAYGVVAGMRAALESQNKTLRGAKIAVQGCGNVSSFMFDAFEEQGAVVVDATDVNESMVERAKARGIPARMVGPDDLSVLETEADVFAPNALGAVLNPNTIPLLRAGIVCGAANNQLQDAARDGAVGGVRVAALTAHSGDALFQRGILYSPDFVVNRMGIVNCANEAFGVFANALEDENISRHFSDDYEHGVYQVLTRIIANSTEKQLSTDVVATLLADAATREPHPMFPGRFQQLARVLHRDQWFRGAN